MLWAVHITDGLLTAPWWLGGYALATVLLLVSAWRIRDDEVPKIALLTAAFFITSVMHVPLGFTSVHLLMNGLVGIVLGPRAALAIFCGLFLQYWLISHGGLQTLGVNTCVLAVPALVAWLLFHVCQCWFAPRHPWFRATLVIVSTLAWLLCLVFSLSLLWDHSLSLEDALTSNIEIAWDRTAHPLTLALASVGALAAAWAERRLENAPEFALGLLLGEFAVLGSVGLNVAVLLAGGEQHWPVPPLVLLVAHLPIAAFEGIVLGFALGFLAKVKPDLIGLVNEPQPGTGCPCPPPGKVA